MGKSKLLVIVSTTILLSLSGILAFNIFTNRSNRHKPADSSKASAMAVSPGSIIIDKDNSGNYTYIPPTLEYDNNNNNEDVPSMSEIKPTEIPWTPATEMDLDPKSLTVFVNKEYALPKSYVPEKLVQPDVLFDIVGYDDRKLLRPEAALALEQLFAAAHEDGYTLYGISGYRSYDRQKKIFTDNIVKKGKRHTLKYSAAPGTSEHQTGLSMDVSSKTMRYKLIATFATSPEGRWLADNAHYFGYIIRYPDNRTDVTGYAYEPWHIRYVGKELASYLYSNKLTLEEYYNYVPSEDFDYEKVYAELINYKPPVTPTPIPSPTPTPLPEDALDEEEDLEDEDNLKDDTEEDSPAGEDDLEDDNKEDASEGEDDLEVDNKKDSSEGEDDLEDGNEEENLEDEEIPENEDNLEDDLEEEENQVPEDLIEDEVPLDETSNSETLSEDFPEDDLLDEAYIELNSKSGSKDLDTNNDSNIIN